MKNLGFRKLNGVTHHEPTESNLLGQSGIHTFVNDVMDIVLTSNSEREACVKLSKFFLEGEVEL